MPGDQIGPMFLAALGLVFGGYGVQELALAYRLEPFDEWIEKALLAAGSLMLAALFASCSYHLLGGAEGLGSRAAWAAHATSWLASTAP